MPILRTLNVVTGEETVHRRPVQGLWPERETTLRPGDRIVSLLPLPAEGFLSKAGTYELWAIYEYDGGRSQGASPPIRIRIRPATPCRPTFDTLQGVVTYATWVNLGADPPDIVRTRFDVRAGGGVGETLAVAGATARSRPVLSLPPNRRDRSGHWIAWSDESALRFIYLSRESGPAAAGRFDLGSGDARIVAPLVADPREDRRVTPAAAALVLLGAHRRLVSVRLTPEGPRPGPAADLPGPLPAWMMNHVRSDGGRLATLVQCRAGVVSLAAIRWTDRDIGVPAELGKWEGEFVAAGATLDLRDAIRGATLLRVGPSLRKYVLARWSVDAGGGFRIEESREPTLDERKSISDVAIRVSSQGIAAMLCRSAEGEWFVGGVQGFRALPPSVTNSRRPLDLLFLNGVEPVVVCSQEGSGFRLLRADGSPLPAE
ncbi:MAG: hypothetical protein HYY17_12100 [Planctomycetes bacterium]|nr:hypothetical protein [Planctomycetota bacterium]